MKLERYRNIIEAEEQPIALEYRCKPHLAERLFWARHQKQFDQAAMDDFAKKVHALPFRPEDFLALIDGCIAKKKLAPIEENPWRECDLTSRAAPCDPRAVVEVKFRSGMTQPLLMACQWNWGEIRCPATIIAWRFAEPQQ